MHLRRSVGIIYNTEQEYIVLARNGIRKICVEGENYCLPIPEYSTYVIIIRDCCSRLFNSVDYSASDSARSRSTARAKRINCLRELKRPKIGREATLDTMTAGMDRMIRRARIRGVASYVEYTACVQQRRSLWGWRASQKRVVDLL